jgi:D-3-phosphoglycerate dehydrogenase / 2-oxoglutarate reductase
MSATRAPHVPANSPTQVEQLRVLVVDPIHEDAIEALSSTYDVRVQLNPSEDELIRLVAHAHILVLRSGVTITRQVIEAARSLRIIARAGVGVDNIDLEGARRAGITVFNVPDASTRAVAEFALGLILAVTRKIPHADSAMRAGRWEKPELSGVELAGRKLGLLGCGRVGLQIAHLATGFGMEILAAVEQPDRQRRHDFATNGVRLVGLKTVMQAADIVCLALPLTSKTRNLIAHDELAMMKRGAYLVNVARAEIINTGDLYDALRNGQLAGAALDVLPGGPATAALSGLDSVVLTPHIAAMTDEAQRRVGERIVAAIAASLTGQPVPSRIC